MVPEIGEKRLRIHRLIPVDHAQEQGHRGLELWDHLTEVVPAVSVQDHELRHALAPERRGHVAQHQGLGARVHVETRSEEHTSELQSRLHLVCRLLLEKKKKRLERGYVLAGPMFDNVTANMQLNKEEIFGPVL